MMAGKRVRQTYAEVLKERDAASKTCVDLVAEMRKLIEKLKDTRLVMAEHEVNAAEAMLKCITTRKGRGVNERARN